MNRSFLMTAAAAALTASASASAPGPVTATDLLNIAQITSVNVAPDGSFAVYTLKTIAREGADKNGFEKYDYHTNLWMVRLDDADAEPMQLTFGDRDDSSPKISPDSSRLAFVRQPRTPDGETEKPKPQVWLLPVGAPGEAQQVTSLEFGATAPTWRPDGGAMIVTSAIPFSKIKGVPDWPTERPGRTWGDTEIPDPKNNAENKAENTIDARPDGDRQSIRNWLDRNSSKQNPVVLNHLIFLEEHGLKGEDKFSQLFLIDLTNNNTATQLTDGFHDHADASFSRDGSKVVYVAKPALNEDPDRIIRTSIFVMNADGTNAQTVLDDADWSYSSPRFATDGKSIVFAAQKQDAFLYRQSRLGIIAHNEDIRWLAPSWISNQNSPVPVEDGVFFSSNWEGGFPLLWASTSEPNAKPTPIVDGAVGVHAFDAAGAIAAAAVTSIDNPSELFVIDRRHGEQRQLTHHNTPWLKNRVLSKPTEHWITRPDGERIQYWVMAPTHRAPGQRYPVALEIHGGPMAMWGPGEFSMWQEFQLLTAWGYAVVYSNPRGSGGYGYDFQRANHQNWGDGPTGDVFAALDEAIKDNDWMDPDRQVVTGGSYAGYLTAWIVGHTDRFKAAVAQRGVYDITTFFGEGNAWRLVEHAMGGFPWQTDIKKVLDHESPFSYVDQIHTPLLIMHGSSDMRTGVSESQMMYRALKELRREVEYVRYPGAGHDLSRQGDPLQRMDRLMRIVEFFERYSNNNRSAPTRAEE